MKIGKLLLILAIALSSGTAYAAAPVTAGVATPPHEASGPAKHEGYGILDSVNAAEHKVKIAHEAIPALGWPAMAMWFPLRTALPRGIQAGDHVRFELQQEGKVWVITRIEPRK